VPYVVTRGRGGVGDRAVHPDDFDPERHELDTDWYAQQVGNAMRRVLELSSEDVEAVFAPVAGAVIATGQSGILKLMGAHESLVWRKTARPAPSAPPTQRQKQMDLSKWF
jgi:DNA polymerase elongation subunit (family B)